MATKAQDIQSQAIRDARAPKAKRARPRRDVPVDTSKPGVSASDRKAGKGHTAQRNQSNRAAKKASYELEDSTTERPTRKSTRGGNTGIKPSHPLQARQVARTTSPKAAATRSGASRVRASAKASAR